MQGALPMPARAKQELEHGLFVYTTQWQHPTRFLFEVELTRFNTLIFQADLTGSHNLKVTTGSELKLQATLQPFTRSILGEVCLEDPKDRATLCVKFDYTLKPVERERARTILKDAYANLHIQICAARDLCFPNTCAAEFAKGTSKICTKNRTLFLDTDYPPTKASIYLVNRPGESNSGWEDRDDLLVWRRPREFIADGYTVFYEGISPSDIRQGCLTDCWFLCAIAALAEYPVLIKELFAPESHVESDIGMYTMRICRGGQWRFVVIDDFFPCYPGGGTAYARNHGNELWTMLIEKAYAKVNGSYATLRFGRSVDALIDLTGAPCRTIRLDDDDDAQDEMNQLWSDLLRYDENGYILTVSTPGEDTETEAGRSPVKHSSGLVAGHAYSLLAVKNASSGHRLVQLRNPWGHMEWNGDWSDESSLWDQYPNVRRELSVELDDTDGTFWMPFESILELFQSINVCFVRHPAINNNYWIEKRLRATIVYDSSSSTSTPEVKAPMFLLSVFPETGQLNPRAFVFAIHQEDSRSVGASPYIDFGVTILRLKPDGSFAFIAGTGLSAERQLQTEISLAPGKYLVVPTCSGAKFRQWTEKASSVETGTEDPLLIMVEASRGTEDFRGLSGAFDTLDSAKLQNVVYDSTKREIRIEGVVDKKIVLSPKLDIVLDEIFRRLDADSDGLLNFEELNAFMLLTEGSELEPKLFEWLVGTFDSSHECKLTSRGFKDAQTYMFCKLDAQERREMIMQDLNVFGYDSDMMLTTARAVSVTIHGELNYEVKAVDYDPAAFRAALELPVKYMGTVTEYDGPVRLYALSVGEFGTSVVVENAINSSSAWKSTGKAALDLLFQLDCSESSSVISHASSLRITERISIGETRALHHVFPSDDWGDRDWDLVYTASMKWDG